MSDWRDQLEPVTEAPAAPTGSFMDKLTPINPVPQQKAVVSANDNGDEAAKALQISKRTGISPSLVQGDLPGYAAHDRTQTAIKYVNENPFVAKYVDSSPMAAKVSSDDYEALSKSSPALWKLHQDSIDQETSAHLAAQVPALAEHMDSAIGRENIRGYVERIKSGFMGGFGEGSEVEKFIKGAHDLGLSQNVVDFWEGSGLLPAARAGEAAIRMIPGLIGGAMGAGSGFIAEGMGSEGEAWGDRFLRDAPGMNAALMGGGASALMRTPKFAVDKTAAAINRVLADKPPVDDLHTYLAEHTPGGPRAKSLSAGETPTDELWQSKPIVDLAKAEAAGKAMDEAVAASLEGRTKERSKESYTDWVKANDVNGTVHIPGFVIKDMYEKAGKVPIEGDGLLGFVPGLAEKMTVANETGADVAIPKDKFVGHIDESTYEALKDEMRVDEKGVSRREAKEAIEEQKTSPTEADTVRFYHGEKGGSDPAGGGPRWVTPSYEYARDFNSGDKPNIVHSVDIPKARLLSDLSSGYDEINSFPRNFEAPEEFAKQLKPYTPDKPVVAATKAVQESLGIKENYLSPLFKDGETLNITKGMMEQYAKLNDRREEIRLDRAIKFEKKVAARRLTPEWKANEAIERAAADKEIYDSPVWAADRFFNQGLALDGSKIPPETRVKLGEVKADDYASMLGFESGSDLSTALLKLEGERADAGKGPKWQFKQQVEAETARRMEKKYGNLEDNIAIEASDVALGEWNVDLLAAEWRILSEVNGGTPAYTRENFAAWTKDQFNQARAGDVRFETWRRAAEKSGVEAEKALLKQDWKEALLQKQHQMLNFLLAKEAKGFEREVARAQNLIGKYADQVNLPAVDQRYTDQIHRLIQQFGVDTRRTTENTDYNLRGTDKDFANFVARENQNGALIVQADLPTPRAGVEGRPIDNLTVDQFRDFATMIESLDHNGRAMKQIEIAGKREDFNAVEDKITKNLDTMEKKDFNPDITGPVSALRAAGRMVDARLRKAENLIDQIDKKDPLGAFNSAVLRGLIEGEYAKGDMITKLAKMASELPGDREWGKALGDLTTNKELLDWETGKPKKLTNENKIAIALNYGNKSNRKVMLEAFHWTEPEVEAYLSRELTPMDKKMVDGIHGLFEPLAPLIEKATSSRAGVAVPLIEGTPWNGMKGGYYPLIIDPRAKLLGRQVDTDLFQKTKFDPLPTANALKQRTGKVYPVDLSINQINSRLSQTAHAVFMQEPVINANKVLSSPAVREGIANAFGPEYVKMLDMWIRDIANNGGSDVGLHDDMASWLSRNVRQNVTVALMGYKASTALIHGGSAGASSMYESFKLHMPEENVGKAAVLAPVRLVNDIRKLGLGQFLPEASRRFFGSQSNMFAMTDFVLENSGEMRNRQRSLQKDFGYQLEKITNSNIMDDAARVRALYQTYSMGMVAYLDTLTATPVWKAAYDHALIEKKMEHPDAVYMADKAVREAHGSASLVSRANIGRGEINKWLTIAYNGYWNHNYNKAVQVGTELRGQDFSASQKVAIGAAFMTAMIVAPALVHHAVRGEESETWGGSIAKMMASQFGGMVPIVNSMVYSMIHNRDPSISPIEEVMKNVTNIYRDAVAKNPKHQFKHILQASGMLTGLPLTNQHIDTFSFLNDVVNQRQNPETVGDWWHGITTGSMKPKRHR